MDPTGLKSDALLLRNQALTMRLLLEVRSGLAARPGGVAPATVIGAAEYSEARAAQLEREAASADEAERKDGAA